MNLFSRGDAIFPLTLTLPDPLATLEIRTLYYRFADPLAMSRPDPYPYEERWQTIGLIGSMIIFVVHTYPEFASETALPQEIGRIIARQATSHERRSYEEESF
jgi:uncharacterized protein